MYWILDNGHGAFSKGKRSPRLSDGRILLEWIFNREIVKLIAVGLKENGIQHSILIPEIEIGNALQERISRANTIAQKYNDCRLVSIHSNAGPGKWTTASGVEIWYYNNNIISNQMATTFLRHIAECTDMKNRGIKSTNKLFILKKAIMPAILTENGFYNNKIEVENLLDVDFRGFIADAHINAILEIESTK